MTLKEIIEMRGHKYDEDLKAAQSDFHKGYKSGWKWAYEDLKEILEQHGFNMEVEV